MDNKVEKIDLGHVDWKSSREFFESLGEELDKLDDKDESYNFTWVGKRKSIIEAGAPINKTLRPDINASKDFDNTKNTLIVGDNLDALKLLQESYLGKIKMIYIDPPYNTGHDFVYHDNFTIKKENYTDNSTNEDGDKVVSEDPFRENSKANGRFHSDWLSMMYPRLKLARNLLTDDGVIFISIDDNEQPNLKEICDEVFGEDNFLGNITWNKKRKGSFLSKGIISLTEYCLVYCKNSIQCAGLFGGQADASESQPIIKRTNKISVLNIPANIIHTKLTNNTYSAGIYGDSVNPIELLDDAIVKNGIIVNSFRIKAPFIWTQEMFNNELNKGGRFVINTMNFQIRCFRIKDDTSFKGFPSYLSGIEISGTNEDAYEELLSLFDGKKMFDYSKPKNYIKQFCDAATHFDSNAIILDFFAGSGTTGHAVMYLNAEDGGNRKYILVQLDEPTDDKSEAKKAGYSTIDQITTERLRRASDKIIKEHPDLEGKLDAGFRVFRIDSENENTDIRKPLRDISQTDLFNSIDNIKKDRTPLDLLFGIIYVSALPFDLKLETRKIGENTVYLYGYLDESTGLVACFDDNIPEETIKEIANLKALTAAFKDSSFADSAAKINLSEQFRVISPDTKVKVI